MLIVGREIGQSVIIGNGIKVTLLQIGTKPKLAINATTTTRISRVKQRSYKLAKINNIDRQIGETLLIGDNVEIALIQTRSGLLRFAIDAPKEISIFREEIYEGTKPW